MLKKQAASEKDCRYFEVVLKRPLHKSYTYKYTGADNPVFKRVLVDFNGQKTVAYVIKSVKKTSFTYAVKEIKEVLDDEPLIRRAELELAEWIARYYICTLGEALSIFLPFAGGVRRPPPPKKYLHQPADKEAGSTDYVLNPAQKQVYAQIKKAQAAGQKIFLLYGITGSGKTIIYAELIREYVERGKQCILMVPEIALTPALKEFLRAYFSGYEVALIHSRIAVSRKYYYWQRIYTGEIKIIIGARSVISVPAGNLGLIIVDEEHENTYKNNATPRYHARQVAQIRCRRTDSFLLLGSATPSIESYYLYAEKKIPGAQLLARFYQAPLPRAKVVKPGRSEKTILAGAVYEKIYKTLSQREQIMIYLNKRGYASGVCCPDCSQYLKCPDCSISLTYHKRKELLSCHYCGNASPLPAVCPACGQKLVLKGIGTERIMEEIRFRLPEAPAALMDSDNVRTEKKMTGLINDFKQRKYRILIGTQMLAKGHDFPGVSLVVIVNPENMLIFPDFRAAERTFSQITQVSGRAGRREKKGEVLVQTLLEKHYAVDFGLRQEYLAFYLREIQSRRIFMYPPFAKLCRLTYRGRDREKVKAEIAAGARLLKELIKESACMLGPAPCLLPKIKSNFRWNLIFKISEISAFLEALHNFANRQHTVRDIYIEYDMEPADML